jgi:hypothetical protein
MKVALGNAEAKDHVAFIDSLEALEAGHPVNYGYVRCWHIHHESARRDYQGGSRFLRSSAPAA